MAVLGEEDAYELPAISSEPHIPLVTGPNIRDYLVKEVPRFWPYNQAYKIEASMLSSKHMWPYRRLVSGYLMFGKTREERGLPWLAYGMLATAKLRDPHSIAYAEVATHNHFSFIRDGKIFSQTAPVIKLPPGSHEGKYLEILGIMNSSTVCFWLKQVCFSKGNATVSSGIPDQPWSWNSAFNSSNVAECPIPSGFPSSIGERMDDLSTFLASNEPSEVCRSGVPTVSRLAEARRNFAQTRASMIFIQEELDWASYRLYKLIDEDLTYDGHDISELVLGERAFEIALAQSKERTEWFERHGSTAITEIPAYWPIAYQQLVRRRLHLIAEHPFIRLLEKPEYKRRWSLEPWEKKQERALRGWLLDRLEDRGFWFDSAGSAVPKSVGQLADEVTRDADMVSVLALWEGRPDVPVADSLGRLLQDEAVPFLAAYRYKDSGLRKREAWDATWDLQRREDRGENVGTIPVPPKYASADFRRPSYWRARGKLDVPKERFILYPDAGREGDSTPLLGWAGWNHAEQSLALARIIGEREQEGWDDERLVPLVAGLAELQPWVAQWHSEVDPVYGVSLAAFCQEQLDQRAAQVGKTVAELAAWRPAPVTRGRRARSKGGAG